MASPHVVELTTDNWQQEVVGSDKPVLVDFWGVGWMPCAKLSPVIDSIAGQFAGRVKVGKVNVSEQFDLASQYGVSSIPRVLFFRGGDQPIRQLVGFVPEKDLVKVIDEVFQP